MRNGLKHCVKQIWEITEVDLHAGVPFTFLGIELDRRANGDLRIHQSAFTKQLLHSYGFDLMSKSNLYVQMGLPADDDGPPDATQLRILQKFCGEFNWLATRTRPDVSYYISVIAQAITKYCAWSLQYCKKVIRYLASTWQQGLLFPWKAPEAVAGSLVSWSDASFAGVSTKSQTGVLIAWEGAIVLWRSSRQASSALSTCEAEVAAAATSWQLVEGLRALLLEWCVDIPKPILLVDNKSALKVSELGGTWRTRYFAIRAARLQEESAAERVSLRYCPTGDMMADGLTKNAGAGVLQFLRDGCDGHLPKIPDATQSFRECSDRATWWGKGLEINFIKASLNKVQKLIKTSKPVDALSSTRAEPPASQSAPPTLTTAPSTGGMMDPAVAAQFGAAMMAALQHLPPGTLR